MHVVSSDEITSPKRRKEAQCKCGALFKIVRQMMDPHTGRTVRMFECGCGERSWADEE
jgi:hypothetical protein